MKFRFVVVMFFVGLMVVLMVVVQIMVLVDFVLIDSCFKKVEKVGGFGGVCVGLVVDFCIKVVEGFNDDFVKWKVCVVCEFVVWMQKIGEVFKKIQVGGFVDYIKVVNELQKMFVMLCDCFCEVFDKVDFGMYQGGVSYCCMCEIVNCVLSLIKLGVVVNEY